MGKRWESPGKDIGKSCEKHVKVIVVCESRF